MDNTKRNPNDLNSPHCELFNGVLGIVLALLVCWQMFFCRLVLGVQSSCSLSESHWFLCASMLIDCRVWNRGRRVEGNDIWHIAAN